MRRFIAISSGSVHPQALPGIPMPVITLNVVGATAVDVVTAYAGPPPLVSVSTFRAPSLAGPYLLIGTQVPLTLHDTGLTSATRYWYRVNIQTLDGRDSMFSTIVSAMTASVAVAPTAPGLPTFGSITSTTVQASWTAASDPVGVTGYELQINGGAFLNQGNVLTASIQVLNPNTTYAVGVRAYNAAGLRGPVSSANVTTASGTPVSTTAAPHLSMYNVGGPGSNYGNAYVQMAAAKGLALAGSFYGGGAAMFNGSLKGMIDGAKALNPNVEVYKYLVTDNNDTSSGNPSFTKFPDTLPHLNANAAWGWAWPNANTRTSHVLNFFGGNYQLNETNGGGLDAAGGLSPGGLLLQEYLAKCWHDYYIAQAGLASEGNSGAAGCFHDNAGTIYDNGQVGWDYNKSGSAPGTANSSVALLDSMHSGMASCANYLQSSYGLPMIANAATWNNFATGSTTLGAMDGAFSGGLIEGFAGNGAGSLEQRGTTVQMISQIQFVVAHTKVPRRVLVDHFNVNANGSDSSDSTPWHAARSLFAMAHMDDCSYNIPSNTLWFEEWAANPTTGVCYVWNGSASSVSAGRGYLGTRIDPVWTKLPNGVYAVRYQNSLGTMWGVFWNPRANGAATVDTITTYNKHYTALQGYQDTTINNGLSGQHTIVFPAGRDGRVVMLTP